MSKDNLHIVRQYIKHNVRVIPLEAKANSPSSTVKFEGKTPDQESLAAYGDRKWGFVRDDGFSYTEEIVSKWFDVERDQGIGVVLGKSSGDLFCLDVEYRDFADDIVAMIDEFLPHLSDAFPIVKSPGKCLSGEGGRHLYFRCDKAKNDPRIAMVSDEESLHRTGERGHNVAVEVLAQGKYVVAPGSHPNTHKSGRPYELLTLNIPLWMAPEISEDDYNTLIFMAKSLDRVKLSDAVDYCEQESRRNTRFADGGDRVGDKFLNDGPSMLDLVADHFKFWRKTEGGVYLTRIGKDRGVSAKIVTGYGKNDPNKEHLYVYSSEARPFKKDQCYDKLGVLMAITGQPFNTVIRNLSMDPRYRVERQAKVVVPNEFNKPISLDPKGQKESGDSSEAVAASKKKGIDPEDSFVTDDFPIQIFPTSLQNFITRVSECFSRTPIDYCATQLLGICSIAIGKTRILRVKQTHDIYCNLWMIVVAPPGDGKTGVLKFLRRQVDRLEKKYGILFRQEIEQYNEQMAEEADTKTKQPTRKRVLVMKTTVEGLNTILEQNPRGIGIIRDEASGFIRSMNQYRQGDDREFWLEAWSNQTQTIDRKSQLGIPCEIEDPFLSVIGGTQPEKVVYFTGGDDDGFSERFLYCYPASTSQPGYSREIVDPDTEATWNNIFAALAKYESRSVKVRDHEGNDMLDPDGKEIYENAPYVVSMSEEAIRVHDEWCMQTDIEYRQKSFDFALRGTWIKMKDYMRKFALIIHEIRNVCEDLEYRPADSRVVDEFSMTAATLLADYFKNHAKKARTIGARDDYDKMIYKLLEFVKNKGGEVTVRQAQQNCASIRRMASKRKDKGQSLYIELFGEMVNRGWGELSPDMKKFTLCEEFE